MPASDSPYSAFNFTVEIDGIEIGKFSEVSGLKATTEVIEYREGGDLQGVRKLPGVTKYADLTLKRGISNNDEMFKWFQQASRGADGFRRDIAISLLNAENEPALRYEVYNAWPTKYIGPSFNASENEIAMETIKIAHEGFIRVD
jgi:phage tail-like protein